MATRVLYIDDVTGRQKLGLPPSSFGAVSFVDTATIDFTITGSNLTADIILSSIISDAIVDGVVSRAPTQNAVFDALALKRNLTDAPLIDQDFDVATPTSNFIVTQTFAAGTKLDVWVNGVLMREGVAYSYQRNVPSNRIDFTSPIQTNAWLRVRVYL